MNTVSPKGCTAQDMHKEMDVRAQTLAVGATQETGFYMRFNTSISRAPRVFRAVFGAVGTRSSDVTAASDSPPGGAWERPRSV